MSHIARADSVTRLLGWRISRLADPQAEVIGHTDSVDTEGFDQKLSEDHAGTVVPLSHDKGVTAKPQAIGKG